LSEGIYILLNHLSTNLLKVKNLGTYIQIQKKKKLSKNIELLEKIFKDINDWGR